MKLFVCLEGVIAGILEGDGTRASFTYSREWLEPAGVYPLSQVLPLQADAHTGRRVLHFIWGLLPDNARTIDAWARQFQVSARNPVALLAHVGEDCAGAVQFVRAERLDAVLAGSKAAEKVDWLDEPALVARIRALVKDGAAARTLEEGQFSLPGAQAKIALHFDRGRRRWGIPRGRTPTTHILKPLANDFDGFAENEHFCLALARQLGLPAARSEWMRFGDIPTLVVERYDRVQHKEGWHRIHQEDCCQALGMHPNSKYENQQGPGFTHLMSLLDSVDDPEADRDRLMSSACLSYLLAATDMHAKNFSLLYTRGERRYGMRLAPFYDIGSAWPYPRRIQIRKAKLAMRVGGQYRLREIVPRHFHKLAVQCGYPPGRLLERLAEYCERLPAEAGKVLDETLERGMDRPVLTSLVEKTIAQCRATRRQLAARAAEA